MVIDSSNNLPLRFGVFELDLDTGELRKSGRAVRLRPQAAKMLGVLASRPGQLVTREELQEQLWGQETFVDFEHSINLCIREIRAALGDDAATPRYVETLPRHGYRFIAPVNGAAAQVQRQLMPAPETTAHADAALPATLEEASRVSNRARRWRITAIAVSAFVLLVLAVLAWRFTASPASTVPIRSLVVLPFTNLSGDAQQEYFVEGLTEALTTEIAKVEPLRVISRTTAMRFKNTSQAVPEIARELRVDAVVEGAVMRSGDHVRITAQLIRAASDEHIWAQRYDRNVVDALAVQGDIAEDIAKQIKLQITPEARASKAKRPVPSLEAQDAYLRGRYEWNKRGPESLLRARVLFKEALDRDPNYALAWVGLADTEYLLSQWGTDVVSPREGMPRAKAAAQRALELDDGLAEAHTSLAMVRWAYDWNWPAAEQEFKRALKLNPNYAIAHQFYGIGLASQGRFEESITEEKRAVELDPLSQIINVTLARMLYTARRYDEATTILRKIVELEPNFLPSHVILGMVAVTTGREEEALREMRKARELAPDSTWVMVNLARAYARSGQRQAALAMLKELEQIAKQRYAPAYQFAIIHAELGETDAAFQWLDRAIEEPSAILMMIKVEPIFDVLRGDPRFAAVVRRIGPR